MAEYKVVWEIEIIADSPREAAERAEKVYMRVADARHFTVSEYAPYDGTDQAKYRCISEVDLDGAPKDDQHTEMCGQCGREHACPIHPKAALFLNVLGNAWRCEQCHHLVDACL